MSLLQESLRAAAARNPQRIALQDGHASMTYGELNAKLQDAVRQLGALNLHALGLLADNGKAWALGDLSAMCANVPLVPLPLFFSPRQLLHVVRDAGLDGLLTDRPQQVTELLQGVGLRCQPAIELAGLNLLRIVAVKDSVLPAGTRKITYTSGTTGEPKGVCLGQAQMEAVAVALRDASLAGPKDRHISLTPLSTLLENIGGIYVPLLAGAHVCLPSLREVGLRGASELDVAQMIRAMHAFDATSAILAPQMLRAMVAAGKCGTAMPPHLRFVAVGGAPVSRYLLEQATRLGIPVFEGYGLSECASVVALNTPDENRPGSVGRPLPHVALSIAEDGEILVEDTGFLGYLGQGAPRQPWPTGDVGYLDEAGFLHLTGRKKSMFITSFGRNVAPEWVERELMLHPAVTQAAVFGEGRPFNVAVIVLRPGFSGEEIEYVIELANRTLPDYARVSAWVAAPSPFTMENGQLTANGRLKREAILAAYADAIEQFYTEETYDVF